jgi:phage terminase large subunit-like protein
VDLDAIEADALELLGRDPAQAERFYGNRVVAGLGAWLQDGLWDSRSWPALVAAGATETLGKPRDRTPPKGTEVCGGFDGSDSDDWTALRLETRDGYGFTPRYGPDRRPTIWNPAEWGGRIPRGEVHAAMAEVAATYRLRRLYYDPPGWQTEGEEWALRYGVEVVLEWPTYRITQMHDALLRAETDLRTGRRTHDGCQITALHVANARKAAKAGQRFILSKPDQHRKIDAAMADTLAHEAASDWRAAVPEAAPRHAISRAAYGFA